MNHQGHRCWCERHRTELVALMIGSFVLGLMVGLVL
jgi:hypothetical protein